MKIEQWIKIEDWTTVKQSIKPEQWIKVEH